MSFKNLLIFLQNIQSLKKTLFLPVIPGLEPGIQLCKKFIIKWDTVFYYWTPGSSPRVTRGTDYNHIRTIKMGLQKKYILVLTLLTIHIQSISTTSATLTTQPIKTAVPNTQTTTTFNSHTPLAAFYAIKFPIAQIKDEFTKNILLQIYQTFGPQGMNLDPVYLQHIQNTYLYLIFLTKLEKVKTNSSYQ